MPLIVLILSVAVFGILVGGKFFICLFADPHPAAGRHRRHRRRGPDAGDPDGRHRSFGRRHHGALIGRHGAVRVPLWHSGAPLHSLRPCVCGAPVRLHQRLAGGAHEAAALHRDARHLAGLQCHQVSLFRERDDPRPGHRGPGAAAAVVRQQAQIKIVAEALRHSPWVVIFMVLLRCVCFSGMC